MGTTTAHYDSEVRQLRQLVAALPVHAPDTIRKTAERLETMQFQFELGNMRRDLVHMTKDDLLAAFDEIDGWSFEEAMRNRNFESEYAGGDRDEWLASTKLERMKFLLRKYAFLTRLRSDEPEAWDTVNELYYDD